MDACNVVATVDLDGQLGETLREEIARFNHAAPERLIIFAALGFPKGPVSWDLFQQQVDQLDSAKAMGARGLKIWKNIGLYTSDPAGRRIALDDRRLDPMWAKADALALPILIHVADLPANFDSLDRHNERYEFLSGNPRLAYHGAAAPRPEQLLTEFEAVVERYPTHPFILAHFANLPNDLAAAGALLDRHPNLSMDISVRVPELGRQPRAAREFFIRYQDRLFFATDGNPDERGYRQHFQFLETADEHIDYPFWPQINFGRWKVSGVELPDAVLRKLYHDNAAKLLGLPLLPVAVEGASRS
jgi:hypothetical protein